MSMFLLRRYPQGEEQDARPQDSAVQRRNEHNRERCARLPPLQPEEDAVNRQRVPNPATEDRNFSVALRPGKRIDEGAVTLQLLPHLKRGVEIEHVSCSTAAAGVVDR